MERELIQVGPTTRVESGPERKSEVATEELLSDLRTAHHYYAGWLDTQTGQVSPRTPENDRAGVAELEAAKREKRAPRYKLGKDAANEAIEIGKPMEYLDYRGSWVWYVYKEQECMLDEKGRITDDETVAARTPEGFVKTAVRYKLMGVETAKDRAIKMAEALED
jgi:hypothetical protein